MTLTADTLPDPQEDILALERAAITSAKAIGQGSSYAVMALLSAAVHLQMTQCGGRADRRTLRDALDAAADSVPGLFC